jgi:hypothetical protein
MRWPREPRVMGILLIFLAVAIYLVMIGEIIPLLWPYRDYPLVRVLLAFISGGHLEELFQETRILL